MRNESGKLIHQVVIVQQSSVQFNIYKLISKQRNQFYIEMSSPSPLPHRSDMEEKAIRKFPFTLNNQTYFSTECFFENTIINGVSLQVKEGKGISNQLKAISYLTYSNRLISYVGCQILSYNTYKRKYQLISQCLNLICLKALSLSTAQKQYIVWVQQVIKEDDRKNFYLLCVFDMNSRQKIYEQKFSKVSKQLDPKDIQIVVFMHPIKVVGFLYYDSVQRETNLVFKKMNKVHEETEFGEEYLMNFPYAFKQVRYDLQSNSYFFIKNDYEIWSLQCLIDQCNEDGTYVSHRKRELPILSTDQLLYIKLKDPEERVILDYAISEAHLAILTCNQINERQIQFYSLFSYGFIFSQNVDSFEENEINVEHKSQKEVSKQARVREVVPIDSIQFNKTILIGLRKNTTQISIFSLFQQSLRHVRNSILDISNCHKIEKVFINPFSAEVLVLSRHYEIEGAISTTLKSTKIIINKPQMKYRNFYLDVSSFFLTTEASIVDVQKMYLQKKNYISILTAPWMSEFIIQTESSVKMKNAQQKFDANIKCSAIHPTGQYIALGFTDCFKIYFLTHEGLIHTFMSENTKECISLCYSRQGQDFAVATPITIFIYDCYSYEKKHQICLGISYRIEEISYIEGCERNKVKQSLQCITSTKRLVCYNPGRNYAEQFAFNPKTHLESGILDSIMAIIHNKTGKPVQEESYQNLIAASLLSGDSLNKNANQTSSAKKSVTAIVYDEETGVVIFSFGSKLYFISSVNFECLGCFEFEEISCIQLCRSLKTLFFGTVAGKILAFPWPNKPINITCKMPTFWTHKSRIKKIKITSNLFELISITDESLFIHSITLIHEMRKIQKHQLQRQFYPKSLVSIDLLLRTGICIFTGDRFQEKCELIKENQQEAVNVLFMLPEQREKQKLNMLNKLETEREKKALKIQEEGVPLKIDAINIKQKTKNIEKLFKNYVTNCENMKDKELELYQQKISELNKEKDELRVKHAQISKQLQKELEAKREQLKLQFIKTETVYRMKIQQAARQANEAESEKQRSANNFYEFAEMDEQRKILSNTIIQHIDTQISELLQRNGYLSCRNTNLEKDIGTKKRKIEDIKELIQSTQRTIKNLPKKSKITVKPEDMKEQNQINKQFAETQRRYLKETKRLIEKNKAINVSIELYEKQREVLIILENQLEKSQRGIEEILDYIMKEKQEKKNIQDKLDLLIEKTKKIVCHYESKNALRIKVKNTLKEYLFQLNLYHQGVIDIQKLKKLSSIKQSEMLSPPQNIHLSIQQKKRKIGKIESSEQKIMNVMKNERKIYSNENRKTCVHNQDLLVNYNFLLHENKHLVNMMKDQREKKKYCIKTITSRKENSKYPYKPTPFSTYLNLKNNRRLKTSPCAEYDLSG